MKTRSNAFFTLKYYANQKGDFFCSTLKCAQWVLVPEMRRTHKKERDCLQPSIAYFYYFIQLIAICSSGPYIVKVKRKIIGMFI